MNKINYSADVWFKISLACAVILLSLTFLFSLTLYQRGRELRVVAQFFPQNPMQFSKLTDATPFESDISDKQLVDEMLIRYYLEMRHSMLPDPREMMARWEWGSPMSLLTNPRIHAPFADNLEKKLEKMPPIMTTVDIVRMQRAKDGNQFNVDFDVYMIDPAGHLQRKKQNAILEFAYYKDRQYYSPFFSNPYGLTIESYEEVTKKAE